MLQYPCQYSWSNPTIFNPIVDALGGDPRLTGAFPNFQNGLFGSAGSGGNLGRRLLRGLHLKGWHH
jgi:hypothetical protein